LFGGVGDRGCRRSAVSLEIACGSPSLECNGLDFHFVTVAGTEGSNPSLSVFATVEKARRTATFSRVAFLY
jgi:hypothetical protein